MRIQITIDDEDSIGRAINANSRLREYDIRSEYASPSIHEKAMDTVPEPSEPKLRANRRYGKRAQKRGRPRKA